MNTYAGTTPHAYSKGARVNAHDQSEVYDAIVANLHSALERWYSGDTHGYVELFADDFTYFDSFGRARLNNRPQLRERYAPLQGNIDLPRFEMLEPTLQLFGETAVLSYNLHQFDHDGPTGPMWNTTEVYRQIDGAWRIVQAHWSEAVEEQAS